MNPTDYKLSANFAGPLPCRFSNGLKDQRNDRKCDEEKKVEQGEDLYIMPRLVRISLRVFAEGDKACE